MKKSYDYNLVIIGGGAAGLSAAWLAARLQAKTLLVESGRPGGECLYQGCVPSKSLIAFVRKNPGKNFSRAMKYVRERIAIIEPHDSFTRYNELGVTTVSGTAVLTGPHTVRAGNREYSAGNILIATGTRPFIPDIPGLTRIKYETIETIWNLKQLPPAMTIIGGGAAGCELAQAFSQLGCKVTILEQGPHLLPAEDKRIGSLLQDSFTAGGIRTIPECRILSVSEKGAVKTLTITASGKPESIHSACVLVLGGKTAMLPEMPASFLRLTAKGYLHTNDRMQTSVKNIYAAGDVTGRMQLTNAASAQAATAVINALFRPFGTKFKKSAIPYAIFTDPEIARAGLDRKSADEQGIKYTEYTYPFTTLNRAVIEDSQNGYISVIAGRNSRILGVTIAGPGAAEAIAEFVLAMKHNIPLDKIMFTPHVYPSVAEAAVYVSGLSRGMSATGYPVVLLRLLQKFRRFF